MIRLMMLTVLLMITAVMATATERPALYDFAPAYPADTLPTFTPPVKYPRPSRTREAVLVLDIDKKGKVTTVSAADSVDNRLADYVRDYLSALRFVPAARNGKEVASRLPIRATFRPRKRHPEIVFPVDTGGEVTERDRFFAAVAANGVTLPRLETFPPYFVEVHWSDTLQPYPFVLLKVTLDPEGRPTAVDTVRSTQSGLTMTTASAALWAAYRPSAADDSPIMADCYLLVSYFPQVVYPTAPWQASRVDSVAMLERLRVQLIPDTVGLMAKPIPRKLPGNAFTVGEARGLFDTISAVLAVDTAGGVSLSTQDRIPSAEWQVLRRVADRLPFYPARDYAGKPHRFSGPVRVILDGSEKVRIEYVW